MPFTQTLDADEICERLNVMKRQESTHYKIQDYLAPEWQAGLVASVAGGSWDGNNDDESSVSSSSLPSFKMDESWRSKMCEWCYRVVDHYGLARESVAVAMNILDRYVSKSVVSNTNYTLATVAAIQIAIKVVSPIKLRLEEWGSVTHQQFSVDDIISMEVQMLSALSWHVHPPTAMDFCGMLIDFSFTDSTIDIRNEIQEKARYLTELSVFEYFFTTRNPSSIAVASIIHAIELADQEVHPLDKSRFIEKVPQVGLDIASQEVLECYTRLRALYRSNIALLEDDGDEYEYDYVEVLEGRGQGSPTGVGDGPDSAPKKRQRVTKDGACIVTEHGEEIAHLTHVSK